jgi:alpha-L-fucosidase 2
MKRLTVLLTLCALVFTDKGYAQYANNLPLRLGADQDGRNPFRGDIAAVRIYERPLTPAEIGQLAKAHPNNRTAVSGLVAQWLFGEDWRQQVGSDRYGFDSPLPTTRVGSVAPAESAGVKAARFAGGYFSVEDNDRLDFESGTIEAWILPQPGANGRIVDKITPGGSDGWLLDTFPGDGLRVIVGSETVTHPLPNSGKWTHVAATLEEAGKIALFVNGMNVSGGTTFFEDLALVGSAPPPGDPLTLWYRQPARRWTEAMVVGNGRLGGMVWGGVKQERVDLNEDTLWSGEPYNNLNPNGLKSLPAIRSLLLAGENSEAQTLVEQNMNAKYNQCYLPLGALTLELPLSGEVRDYIRQLDLNDAMARVQFTHEGTRYTREIFASYPDNCMVVHLTTDKPGKLSFRASLDSQLRHEVAITQNSAGGTGGAKRAVLLKGRAPVHSDPHYVGKRIAYDDAPDGKGMRFESRLMASHTGGSLSVTEEGVVAENCDSVTLTLVAATSYNGPHRSPSTEGKDPAALCDSAVARFAGKSHKALREAHVSDYRGLFQRVQLDLGRSEAEDQPTDVRFRKFQPGKDPSLATLYFQFGRYLLIAGSRPGSQPLNLQGIWNKDLNPAWSANWTLNCNAQINYWPVEVANLAECHEPLVDLTTELSIDGTNIARNLYGAGGWVAHHNTDIWRQAGPVAGSACWSVFQVGSAWLCQHLWEHYAFSGDTNYLRQVWPVLSGAARFYLDSLIPEPSHGWLVTAPDVNFENAFRRPNGETACSCYGPTASMQMIRELFKNCIQATSILQTDSKLRTELEESLSRLAPMQISPTTGELQEWVDDWQRTAECQVLSSWGAICSAQITPRGTPELAAGLRRIFDTGGWWKKGAVGSWQGAFQANAYARLHDGDTSLGVLDMHLRRVVNPNLSANFGGMAEWEIDGNLGLTAVICEMLLQSHSGEIELLPALPRTWRTGSVKGLRARGGYEVDLTWADGRLQAVQVRAANGGIVRLRYGDKVETLTLRPTETHNWNPN